MFIVPIHYHTEEVDHIIMYNIGTELGTQTINPPTQTLCLKGSYKHAVYLYEYFIYVYIF